LIGKAHFQPLASTPEQQSLECQPTLRDLDFWRQFKGPWYGFEDVELARNHADESHVGQHYAIWMEEKGLKNWRDYFRQWPKNPDEKPRQLVWDLPEEFHYTTWTAERTIASIEKSVQAGKPFFTWASFHDPHPPYLVPEPRASMYDPDDMEPGTLTPGEFEHMAKHFQKTQERIPDFSAYKETPFTNHGFECHLRDIELLKKQMAVYYGMISFMDAQIGRILDSLDQQGIADNTLIVFTSDHGHFLGQHGLVAKGAFHYEDLLKLPFIVRYPGQVPTGLRSSALQALIDLAPTFLTAAGIPVPGLMQGVNQLDVWRGNSDKARDEVIVENRHQPTALHLRTYIDQRYKLTVYRDRNEGEFFDLAEDPGEIHNRWDDPAYAVLKAKTMHRFINAELKRESTRFPRIATA
jgi:arylsulfatase A-like enzyme